MKIKDFLLAICSGILVFVSFPKFNLYPLAFLSLIPLLFSIEGKKPTQAFVLGLITGATIMIGGFCWLVPLFKEFANIPFIWGGLLLFLYASFSGLNYPFACYFINYLSSFRFKIFLIALCFGSWEFLYPRIFPWYIANTQFKNYLFIQVADIIGVAGISFLIFLANAFLYNFIKSLLKNKQKLPLKEAGCVVFIFLFVFIYGFWRFSFIKKQLNKSEGLKVAIVQTNIGNLDKLQAEYGYRQAISKAKQNNQELVLAAGQKEKALDLIVLPETSVPGVFSQDRFLQLQMFALAYSVNTPILFGGYDDRTIGKRVHNYNSAFLISKNYQLIGHYDKVNLLAFGEYMPLGFLFGNVQRVMPAIGNFTPGEGPQIFPLDSQKIAPLICYEVLFPDFVRKFVKKGATFLVNITNDSWFLDTGAPYQHQALSIFRAVENRVPIVRAANTGISCFIDPLGRIHPQQTKLFVKDILVDQIKFVKTKTLYTQFGDWLAIIASILFIIFTVIEIKKKRT